MKYHLIDINTGIYISTIDEDIKPSNSVEGYLPEQTEYYTIAYINNEWVSVVRPEYFQTDDGFILKD